MEKLKLLLADIKLFFGELFKFVVARLHLSFLRFEKGKGVITVALYRQRGRLAKRLMHSGMAGITALGVMIAPIVAQEFPGSGVDPWAESDLVPQVLSAFTGEPNTSTYESGIRGETITYEVSEGDTVSSIAEKFGVSEETVLWRNSLTKKSKIKVGQELEVLPITGISHKVKKGDTVYSIAKKYDSDPQAIADYPFNAFVNDETFELAIGQTLIVPDGVMPSVVSRPSRIRRITPDAGTVVASGSFVWPTSGKISQNYAWYHKGIDIANKSAPNILAADSGTVVVAGWPDGYGYGNRIVIDHGNGYRTRYAHLSSIYVTVGQTVARGNSIGRMGSTGRSTGTHLHFEIIRNGVHLNPLSILQ